MATLLDTPFAKLAASDLVPIPNVFSDPADHAWPLDVLLLRRDWITGLLALAQRAGHPLPSEFGPYFQAFLAAPFDGARAIALFHRLAADGTRRFALSSQIASACRLAVATGYPTLQPAPFHSGRYLASVLETAFQDSGAFRVEALEIVTRSEWRSRIPADVDIAYRSLALGHERVLGELPARLLDESMRARPTAEVDTLVEVAVFRFVATRLPRERRRALERVEELPEAGDGGGGLRAVGLAQRHAEHQGVGAGAGVVVHAGEHAGTVGDALDGE
jgi:hypothetical protein